MGRKQKIKYSSIVESYRDVLVPSIKNIPHWYKNIKKISPQESVKARGSIGKNIKNCTPFIDSLSIGYQMVLPYDLEVVIINNQISFTWTQMEAQSPITSRDPELSPGLPVPSGCSPVHFSWHTPSFIRVEKGYSFLVTHPLNRHDLPFVTLSGIVDGGWSMYDGNLPFFIKEGFEGTIPQGTPIAQIIPFKNDSWVSVDDPTIMDSGRLDFFRTQLTFSTGFYKKAYWQKKSYE